jgi:MFS family permease
VLRLIAHRLPADLRQHRRLGAALLLFARLLQGLSVGGEYGTTATYMSEVALKGQRGFFASFQYVTLIGGQLLAVCWW